MRTHKRLQNSFLKSQRQREHRRPGSHGTLYFIGLLIVDQCARWILPQGRSGLQLFPVGRKNLHKKWYYSPLLKSFWCFLSHKLETLWCEYVPWHFLDKNHWFSLFFFLSPKMHFPLEMAGCFRKIMDAWMMASWNFCHLLECNWDKPCFSMDLCPYHFIRLSLDPATISPLSNPSLMPDTDKTFWTPVQTFKTSMMCLITKVIFLTTWWAFAASDRKC